MSWNRSTEKVRIMCLWSKFEIDPYSTHSKLNMLSPYNVQTISYWMYIKLLLYYIEWAEVISFVITLQLWMRKEKYADILIL